MVSTRARNVGLGKLSIKSWEAGGFEWATALVLTNMYISLVDIWLFP
jgi:hypothetical protein